MICEQMTDARRKTRPIASNGTCSKEDASNREQLALARRKTRPITSNWRLLEGRRVQSRATGTCSKEDASNREQLALARRKTRPITSNWHLLEGRRVQSRATGTFPKKNASNHEQRAGSEPLYDRDDVRDGVAGSDAGVAQRFGDIAPLIGRACFVARRALAPSKISGRHHV